jgi:transcription elongation regulator 1
LFFFLTRCVVWTGDGRVFFYNPSSRTSVWERPEDLIQRADVDKAVGTPPEQLLGSQVALAAAAAHSTKKNGDDGSSKTSINDGGVVMMDLSTSEKKRSDSDSSENSDETPNKKVKVDVQSKNIQLLILLSKLIFICSYSAGETSGKKAWRCR